MYTECAYQPACTLRMAVKKKEKNRMTKSARDKRDCRNNAQRLFYSGAGRIETNGAGCNWLDGLSDADLGDRGKGRKTHNREGTARERYQDSTI